MSDYSIVTTALKDGTDPDELCRTCPWTRACIEPPTMTAMDIERLQNEAKERDAADSDSRGAASLIGALLFAGKDTTAQVCPVFAIRLRSEEGRQVVADLRERMRSTSAFSVEAELA